MSRLQGVGAYALYRLAAGAISLLPEPAARRLGEAVGWSASFLARDRLALVRRHLARVVGEEAATVPRARSMFASYGRYWAEVFWVTPRRTRGILAASKVIHPERLTEASAKGKGVIVALPHSGNWESAGLIAVDLGVPVLAAAEGLPNRRLVAWFIELRRKMGMEVVVAGQDRHITAKLMRRLQAGGTVALVADRDLSGRGIPVMFFGEKTTLPAGPATLADRTGAALIPVACFFAKGRGNIYVIDQPIDIPDLPTKAQRVAAATQSFAQAMEGLIRCAPEQWHLFQPNWPSDRADA